jgi:copper chaperone
MKHKITAIFTITALISLTLFAGETKEVSFNINGMTCQGCVGKVSGILDNTPGVNNYKVSIEDKNCKISYDAALTSPEAIKTELSKTHFTIGNVVAEKHNSSIFSWIKNIFN